MTDRDGTVLLVGLDGEDRGPLVEAVRSASPTAAVLEIAGRVEATEALSTEVVCVIVGRAAGSWEGAGADLRRIAPHAALIAVTDAELGPAWDDAVRPHEREPVVLARILRSAFAIAAANRRAMRDPLTDLLNRRGLERVLLREASEQERGHGPVVALLVDCDDFKSINDRFGLSTGDDVLRRLAEVLTRSVRARDTVARVGGDEFVVVLPATRTWEAVEVAERIRASVRSNVRLPDCDSLSVSIGVRRLAEPVVSVTALVGATQDGLRQSKVGGKDQVRVVGGSASAAVRSLPSGFPESGDLVPPGAALFTFRTAGVRQDDPSEGPLALQIVRPDLGDDAMLVISAHRASQPAWDLQWFRRALEAAPSADLPVHVRIFPATLRDFEAVRAAVPDGVPLSRLTLAIDDQYLTGDPGPLKERLDPLRAAQVALCLDVTDLGRTCLEALVLLRPERVRLDPSLTAGVTGSRIRRGGLSRFARVCDALGIVLIAAPDLGTGDAETLRALGIRLFEGARGA